MIIVMCKDATETQIETVIAKIETAGCEAALDLGVERTVIGVRSGRHDLKAETFKLLPGVEDAVRISKPYKLASREFHEANTTFRVGDLEIGGNAVVMMGGPCSIENEEQIFACAHAVKDAGGQCLRGGAFKPRSSPYSFQGMGEEGLKILSAAGRETGLPVITEIMDLRTIDLVAAYADIFQVGARNMQNYDLLKELGATHKPVFLKRGLSATIEELLLSAEYLLAGGTADIILCERGIRTYETATRNTLDIAAVPVLKSLTHLPVFVDPSHAAGVTKYVGALALAGIAAGADGLMVEMHPDPANAASDGQQCFDFAGFAEMMKQCKNIAHAIGRAM